MECWLSGKFSHLDTIPRLLCCSLEHSLADITKFTESLSETQIWAPQGSAGTVGFQLRHLAGSVDRLITYAANEVLSPQQLAFLRTETEPGATKADLLTALAAAYRDATQFAQSAAGLTEPRFIGRQRLETPLGVLLGHIAEHTQRHTGQLIVLAKFAYGSRS
jgi:uncharacterized damage-inducible protein DinB